MKNELEFHYVAVHMVPAVQIRMPAQQSGSTAKLTTVPGQVTLLSMSESLQM